MSKTTETKKPTGNVGTGQSEQSSSKQHSNAMDERTVTTGQLGEQTMSEDNTQTPELENHPLADMFPMLSDGEQRELIDDIGTNGQLEPIWLYEGKILDGRNRNMACMTLNIAPIVQEYEGSTPAGFVISKNVKRRHLTESQRAMIVADLEQYQHGGARKKQDANGHVETRAELSASLQVSSRSTARAKNVKKSGTPEEVQAVRDGKLSVGAAEKRIQSRAGNKKQQESIALQSGEQSDGLHGVTESSAPVSSEQVAEDAEGAEQADNTQAGSSAENFSPVEVSKTPSSLTERIISEFQFAQEQPMNSPEQLDALVRAIVTVINDCFTKRQCKEAFLDILQSKISEIRGKL